jgi:hypothetical protein
LIRIKSADEFFSDVLEKVESLEQLAGLQTLSAKVAIATEKRFLVYERLRIDLHDLVMRETEKVVPMFSPVQFPVNTGFSAEELEKRLKRYEALTEILVAMLSTGCYWGGREHSTLWTKVFNRIANPYGPTGGVVLWIGLRLFPTLLLLYAAGIAAVAAGAYDALFAIMMRPKVRDGSQEHPLPTEVNAASSNFEWAAFRNLPQVKNHKTPVSDYLFAVLREPLREFLPDDVVYQACFDKFEYVVSLVHTDITEPIRGWGWAPVGCYIWRGRSFRLEIPAALAGCGKTNVSQSII